MKRTPLILFGLLVVLGAVAYLVTLKPGEQSVESTSGELLATIDSALVDKVEIHSATGPVTLERRGVEWFITSPIEYKANHANVASLLEKSKDLRVKGIVSSKPEKHALFQVDSTGTMVRLYQAGQERAAFVVGKASGTFSDTYVRKASGNDVAMVDGSFAWMFNRSVRDWRNKAILDMVRANVTSVGFRYGDTTFALELRDSVWMIGKEKANPSTVDNMLNTLVGLQCDDFLDAEPTVKPSIQLTVDGTQVLFAYEKESKKYYTRTSASSQWFILESWRAEQVLKRRKDLL